jgi:hypothetical protein
VEEVPVFPVVDQAVAATAEEILIDALLTPFIDVVRFVPDRALTTV